MAYNFIPKTREEIAAAKLKTGVEMIALFDYIIEKSPKAKEVGPLAIDKSAPTRVKIVRSLNGVLDPKDLKRVAPKLTISWGNGSRGNMGAANRGNLFEGELAEEIMRYMADEDDPKLKFKKPIKELLEHYDLHKKANVKVSAEGALNKPRPLMFMGDTVYVGGTNNDIGKTVVDLLIKYDNTKEVYLSLKMGNTVTFFNAGVARILTSSEIQSGLIQNQNGLSLLKLFGIDNAKFCQVFEGYSGSEAKDETIDTFAMLDKTKLTNFIKSGIGYGYHMVHKVGNHIHHFEIDKNFLENASKPMSCSVRYPMGVAKRIDINVETPVFQFKFNIRNKQGGVYPSHIMADYKIKH